MADHTDKRKQSLYFPEDMLREIEAEAQRLDRSLSWVVQHAWKLARAQMSRIPGVNDPTPPAP
jgi:uncharacterized small protein (TIGR04563 family)